MTSKKGRRAETETRNAPLSSEFGLAYATRLFGAEAVASLPVLKAGPNKGKPKGYLIWLRTTSAGYHVCAGGPVGAGVTVRAWIGAGPFAPDSAALEGMFLGRRQAVCASMIYLGEENRARAAAERGA